MSDTRTESERTERLKFPEIKVKDGVNNYGAWAVKAKYRLRTMELWGYIEGPSSDPPVVPELHKPKIIRGPDQNGNTVTIHYPGNQTAVDTAQAIANPWIKKDGQALDLIMNAVPDDLLYLVKRSTSAKQAWTSLRTSLQPSNSTRALAIKQRIVSYSCESSFNVMTWLDDCQRQYDELCNMDPGSMPDVEFAKTLLNNMPVDSSWRNFMSGLRQQYSKQFEHPGSIEVINTIRDEYWAQHKDDPGTYSTVFAAKFQAATGAKKRQLDMSSMPDTSDSKRSKTTTTTQWRDKSKLWCTVKDCESPARHEASDCFAYGGGKQGQYPPWYRGPRDIHLPKAQREQRKTRPRVRQLITTPSTPSTSVATTSTRTLDNTAMESRSNVETPTNFDQPRIDHLFDENANIWSTYIPPGTLDNTEAEIATCTVPLTDPNVKRSDDCYHDSGANVHVFNRQDVFAEYSQINPVRIHAFSKGLSIAANGKGSVRLQATYEGIHGVITLTNCLYVPGAHANLISQIRLDKFGISTLFDKGRITIFKDGIPRIDGGIHNDMWRLNLKPLPSQHTVDESIIMGASVANPNPDFYTA
jgi:hypothetical protein